MPYSEVWIFFFPDGFKEWFPIKGNISLSWGHLTKSRDILFIKIVGMVVLLTSRRYKTQPAAKYLMMEWKGHNKELSSSKCQYSHFKKPWSKQIWKFDNILSLFYYTTVIIMIYWNWHIKERVSDKEFKLETLAAWTKDAMEIWTVSEILEKSN